MAFKHSKSTIVKIDNSAGTPVDLSAYIVSIGFERPQAMHDSTTLGVTANTFLGGLTDGDSISMEFLYDPTVVTHLEALFGLTATTTVEFGPEGITTGMRKLTCETLLEKISYSDKVADLIKITASFKKSGAVTSTTYP